MEYKYKTKGDVEFVVPGVGVTVDGFITSPTPIENPNLELVENKDQAVAPAPAHMDGVVPQNTQPAAQVQAPVQAVAPPVAPANQTPTAPAVESNGSI